jgi:hypothetical protein
MPLRIRQIDLHVLNMHTRLPFRYGIVTVRSFPHLFLRLELEVDGQRAMGVAADHLAPKWFTKNPQTTIREDIGEMIEVIRSAQGLALEIGSAATPFEFWMKLYQAQKRWATGTPYPPLLWNFGVSLVERAVIEAFCRARSIAFSQALRRNQLGIDLGRMYRELAGIDVDLSLDLLPKEPLRETIVRHTVGLTDPLEESDIGPGQALDDGLPQSLDQCIRAYGIRHLKIKLSGDVEADAARLRRIAGMIPRLAGADFRFTLDANENFKELSPFRALWESLAADAKLKDFLARLIFVEQPFHRDIALSASIRSGLLDWPTRPPMIIDESDAEIASLFQALDCGYVGTSHKNCKGIFKSIGNACKLKGCKLKGSGTFSGEDLSNVAPVALFQDLAVAANLGISSIERNGHHYFRGASMLPQPIQAALVEKHGDLYQMNPGGFAAVRIDKGLLKIGSLIDAPLGMGFEFDPRMFTPLDEWSFDSLGVV